VHSNTLGFSAEPLFIHAPPSLTTRLKNLKADLCYSRPRHFRVSQRLFSAFLLDYVLIAHSCLSRWLADALREIAPPLHLAISEQVHYLGGLKSTSKYPKQRSTFHHLRDQSV